MKSVPARLISMGLLSAVLGLQLSAAQATEINPQDLPEPSSEMLADSVRVWDPSTSVRTWDPSTSVKAVEQVETDGDETTITLATDILFTPDSSKLPDSAANKLKTLLEKVPKGAEIDVNGHTDSVKGKVENKKLSTDRAKAVASAVKEVRPDLKPKIEGLADTQPAVREDPKDPSTLAANRRVEIIYSK